MVNRRQLPCGRGLALELLPNPSHLEAVNPLVSGRARALQLRLARDHALQLRLARDHARQEKESVGSGAGLGSGVDLGSGLGGPATGPSSASSGTLSAARGEESALTSARRRCVPLVVHGDAPFYPYPYPWP